MCMEFLTSRLWFLSLLTPLDASEFASNVYGILDVKTLVSFCGKELCLNRRLKLGNWHKQSEAESLTSESLLWAWWALGKPNSSKM